MHRVILAVIVFSALAVGCTRGGGEVDTLKGDAANLSERLANVRKAVGFVAGAAGEVLTNQDRYDRPLHPERAYATYADAMVYAKAADCKSSILGTGAVPVVGDVLARMKRIEHLEPVLERQAAQCDDISMIWFATPESLAVFWPPYDMVALVPPKLDITQNIIPYQKAAEGNPSFGHVWLEPYVDITGKGYMTTVSQPVRGPEGQLLGVAGADVALEPLVRRIDDEKFAGRMLLSSDTYVLAVGDRLGRELGVEALGRVYYLRQVQEDVHAPDRFRLDMSSEPRLSSLGGALKTAKEEVSLPWGGKILGLRVARVQETGWLLVEGTLR